MNQNILLVQPKFPTPSKSLNHKDFLPIPLLKIASYHKTLNDAPHLVHGKVNIDFEPDLIYITSLFTYWQKEFWETAEYYRTLFPNTPINVGGIYVSLFFENSEFQKKCAELKVTANKGTVEKFEKSPPDYSLVDVDYQIIHASRGCKRHCTFCGVWKIEQEFVPKESIKNEIVKNKLVFYDNNLLANPYIERILKELSELKIKGKSVYSESQSGFDGRLLTLKLAKLLKKARFINPRIAWDNSFEEWNKIEKQINILLKAGYKSKDISIFMIYNWDYTFDEMELKRKKCFEWGVQIADCRNRPLTQEFDDYNGRVEQTNKDYYIHKNQGWTDLKVKKFRKNVRRQNICVRNGYKFHSSKLERKVVPKSDYFKIVSMPMHEIKRLLPDAWWPSEL
ncbi:MAG: Fe-S oxidoreductase [Candidatus Methanoperedenaceae archaeon]|nr:Fe-S oxidoreductase [Candidatus Methanoperedenaceae archaeon]